MTALEDQGICVFVAPEESILAQRVGRYLSGHGFLRWEDAVEVVAAEEPASEPSDADDIWTRSEIEFPRLEFRAAREEPAADEAQVLENEEEVSLQ